MDDRSGEIMSERAMRDKMEEDEFMKHAVPVETEKLDVFRQRQLRLEGKTRIGPNTPCACGSGKKFKKCHMR